MSVTGVRPVSLSARLLSGNLLTSDKIGHAELASALHKLTDDEARKYLLMAIRDEEGDMCMHAVAKAYVAYDINQFSEDPIQVVRDSIYMQNTPLRLMRMQDARKHGLWARYSFERTQCALQNADTMFKVNPVAAMELTLLVKNKDNKTALDIATEYGQGNKILKLFTSHLTLFFLSVRPNLYAECEAPIQKALESATDYDDEETIEELESLINALRTGSLT